jgi:hypothetical protein
MEQGRGGVEGRGALVHRGEEEEQNANDIESTEGASLSTYKTLCMYKSSLEWSGGVDVVQEAQEKQGDEREGETGT